MQRKPWRGTWNHLLQEADWPQLLSGYQQQPGPLTSARLLAALEPAAKMVCRTLPRLTSGEPEDVWQQFQLALLQESRRLPMPGQAHAIPFRILERARRSVSRWIARQRRELALPLSDLLPSAQDVESDALGWIDGEADPVYRRAVLGESLAAQARSLGVPAVTIRVRAYRRRRHLRALRASDKW